jgi:hypothetical protein
MNKYQYRLGLSQAGMKPFTSYGIPTPLVVYRDYSIKMPRSQGSTSKHGYKNAQLLFPSLTRDIGGVLYQLVEDAGDALFLTINRHNGERIGYDWIDISGRPDLSDLAPTAPAYFWGVTTYANVVLTLNNITVITEAPVF